MSTFLEGRCSVSPMYRKQDYDRRQRVTLCVVGLVIGALVTTIIFQHATYVYDRGGEEEDDEQSYALVVDCEPRSDFRYLRPGENGGHYRAVASFPRSGSVETMLFFQVLTGVYSGSVHYARTAIPPLLVNPGHEDVWVVETHNLSMRPADHADRYATVIYLVRDPFDAIWCELYQTRPENPRFTPTYLFDKLRAWDRHVRFWTSNVEMLGDRRALVVRYEDLETKAPFRRMARLATPTYRDRANCLAADMTLHPASCPGIDGRREILARSEEFLDQLDRVMGEIAESVLAMGYDRRVM